MEQPEEVFRVPVGQLDRTNTRTINSPMSERVEYLRKPDAEVQSEYLTSLKQAEPQTANKTVHWK